MDWLKNLRLSVNALRRRPAGTLLSASAMAVGVTSMVTLLGLGGGAERAFREALESLGENLLVISPALPEESALRGARGAAQTLTLEDWRAVSDLEGVERTAPLAMLEAELRHGGRALRSTVIGTTAEFRWTHRQRLVAGRFLDAIDVTGAARVAVVGAGPVKELFAGEHPLGQRLMIAGQPFVIIGVLGEKGADPTGADQDNRVLIPVLTAQRRLLNVRSLDGLFLQASSERELTAVQRRVRNLLRTRHDTAEDARDDFMIRDQAAVLEALRSTDRTFDRLLGGLAALTLGLASLGLLAVSLLSVRERHGEIGLRLAVGGRPWQVLCQFLAENVMVGLLGAAGGLLAGLGGIILGQGLFGWQLAVTWQAVLIPLALSWALSLAFGAYPALRAARLDPVATLRSAP